MTSLSIQTLMFPCEAEFATTSPVREFQEESDRELEKRVDGNTLKESLIDHHPYSLGCACRFDATGSEAYASCGKTMGEHHVICLYRMAAIVGSLFVGKSRRQMCTDRKSVV